MPRGCQRDKPRADKQGRSNKNCARMAPRVNYIIEGSTTLRRADGSTACDGDVDQCRDTTTTMRVADAHTRAVCISGIRIHCHVEFHGNLIDDLRGNPLYGFSVLFINSFALRRTTSKVYAPRVHCKEVENAAVAAIVIGRRSVQHLCFPFPFTVN